ncbi:unnamed protein product, partial [Polarella glacialis]
GPPMQAAGVAAKSSSSSSSFLPAYSTSSTSCSSSSSAARTWTLYVDGSCPANRNVREKAVSPAGWGVAVYGPLDAADSNAARTVPGTTADSTACSCELFGPVVIENGSPLSLGAEVGSNNTGELSSIGEALLWLRDEAPGPKNASAVIYYDSEYAANIATRRHKAHKNLLLAETVQKLWAEVRKQRPVELIHVKGHSGCPGNELADRLADK